MAGFEFAYTLNGGTPLIQTYFMKDTETFTLGDLMNVESGELDLAVTGDTALVGTFMGPHTPSDGKSGSPGVVEGTDSVTRVRVIISPDAVYSVTDSNDRDAGATLDISGATGAQAVAASSNTEFVVVGDKQLDADPTYVMITPTAHFLAKT
jgi:hypothetical protein